MPEVFLLASDEERPSQRVVLLVRDFFLAALRLAFALRGFTAQFCAPNEKKTSGTQGNVTIDLTLLIISC